jgi:two-component system sensor histidine kinase MtrB
MSRFARGAGLRRIAGAAALALTANVLIVCSALVILTSELHGASTVLRDAVASVRLAEGAEVDLLTHDRARDDVVRHAIGNELRRKLDEAGKHVTSESERVVLGEAARSVERYLATFGSGDGSRGTLMQAAHLSLRKLVGANVAQADTAQRRAHLWDKLGNVIGFLTGAVTIAILATLSWWIRRAVVGPALSLAASMRRFGNGERDVRGGESGATEIRDMARQFNRMADAIGRKEESRLAYLAGIAHDLRNPLTALRISIDGIKADRPLPPENQLRQRLSVVQRQVTRLNRMIGDLLDASRIEAGHLSLQIAAHDLRLLIQEAVELFDGVSPVHDLRVDLPAQPVEVLCDELRMAQTLNNLLSNAIKYSPRGGDVRVEVRAEDDRAILSVADNGVGIPDGDVPHIWEPFRRTGASTEAIPGVGLGLWVAKRIVEAQGGTIAVESSPGAGSTFSVVLPLLKVREAANESQLVIPASDPP